MAQPADGRSPYLRACVCGWGKYCNAARKQQPWAFANHCVRIPREDREHARKLLMCKQLELCKQPERVEGQPAVTAYVAGREPKDVRLWIGHFLGDDLCGPMDADGRKTTVKAQTAHEHYVVTPLSGQQPAPVPARPKDGRDALVHAMGEHREIIFTPRPVGIIYGRVHKSVKKFCRAAPRAPRTRALRMLCTPPSPGHRLQTS